MTKFTTVEDETIGCTDSQCENRSQISQNAQDDNGATGTGATPTPFPSTVESTDNPENINGNSYGFECEGVKLPAKSNDIHPEETTTITNDETNENNATLSPSASEDGAVQTNVSLDDYKCPICLDIFINVSLNE